MISGNLPESFTPVNFYEMDGEALVMRLADLKKLGDDDKAELVVHYPTRRSQLTDVPHGPGIPGHWGYEKEDALEAAPKPAASPSAAQAVKEQAKK